MMKPEIEIGAGHLGGASHAQSFWINTIYPAGLETKNDKNGTKGLSICHPTN